jgi:hypothetical protein
MNTDKKFELELKKFKIYSGRRPFHWCHLKAVLIWLDATFNCLFPAAQKEDRLTEREGTKQP